MNEEEPTPPEREPETVVGVASLDVQAKIGAARVTAQSAPGSDPASIRTGSGRNRSTSESGSAGHRQTFEGDPSQNEDNVPAACGVLRHALRERGDEWSAFTPEDSRDSDVDAWAENEAGERLHVQVIRVEREAWGELAHAEVVEATRDREAHVDDIRAAIEKKWAKYTERQRSELLLALDAIDSPGHVHAVDDFVATQSAWVAGLGFREVWLVASTTALTRQLA